MRRAQDVVALFALAASDNLSNARHEHVHGPNRPVIFVHAHVESFDFFWIVSDHNRLFENFFGQKAFVLALQIAAPKNGELPFPAFSLCVFQNLDCFSVGDVPKIAAGQVLQHGDQSVVDTFVEKLQVGTAAIQHSVDEELQELLRQLAIAVQVAKGHFRLNHPEFRQVSRRSRFLSTETRSKSVHIRKGQRGHFRLQLSAHGQEGSLAKKILRVINLPAAVTRQILQIERGHAEHRSCTFGIGGRDHRSMKVEKAPLLKELMNKKR